MGLLEKLGMKKRKPVQDINEGVQIRELPDDIKIVEEYEIEKSISSVIILKSETLGEGLHYYVVESPLNEAEAPAYTKIMKVISKEMEPPLVEDISPKDYLREQIELIKSKYARALGKHTPESWEKIFYYVIRNLAGYGSLHTIMMDPNIEDISHNGINNPIYIWHKKYESIPSNVIFTDEQIGNDFIVKLAHKSSKHISSAVPILDGMLPEKHRLAATFMNEVSMKGSTFTIRKFREDPFSIMDLIRMGTLDARIAAYFWILLEHKKSFMIVGGTGAGKTSILNSLLSLMSTNDKIVTVEEVPELYPPLNNWTQFHSRQDFSFGDSVAKSISLFDLVKVSLRYRPDYIIVGEVRGEEAYTLFQALATGHGGLC
ncbi:MAG: type II/IV secretion system ATPase subunit, partial [Candidatus Bathyarchaeia archaeon]